MPDPRKDYFETQNRRAWYVNQERRVAGWFQGWLFIVIGTFAVKAFTPALPWNVVAFIALGQTVLGTALMVLNHLRHGQTVKMNRLENEIGRAG